MNRLPVISLLSLIVVIQFFGMVEGIDFGVREGIVEGSGSTVGGQSNGGSGMSLWIDEEQVREYSGYAMTIHVIIDDVLMPYVMDLQRYLPIVPPELTSVNFTWKVNNNRIYRYHFDQLVSFNTDVLADPSISLPIEGRVSRRRARRFSVHIPCHGNSSGVASFAFGLRIVNDEGQNIPGTPLRFRLQKQCRQTSFEHGVKIVGESCGSDGSKICQNGGWCNRILDSCECPKGFIGEFCQSAFCYPDCMNGGSCISPGRCKCLDGYQGPHCEGGICREKCLNGGKCVQKDTCSCRRGFFGDRCQFSKCSRECLNGGRCVGEDKFRCRRNYSGQWCEDYVPSPDDDQYYDDTDQVNQQRRRKKKKKKYV